MVLIVRTPAHDRVLRGGIDESEERKREGGFLRRDMVRVCIVRMLENGGFYALTCAINGKGKEGFAGGGDYFFLEGGENG